jgi:FKBP-type peptidyl-prolyl cis-trans isomerase
MKKINNLFLIAILFGLLSCLDKDGDTGNAQLVKEVKAIDEYLANSQYSVAYDGNGSRIEIVEFGDGAPPHKGQTVIVEYTARLFPEGTVFDQGTITDKVENINGTGFRRGVASILKGSYANLFIPSDYAYGSKGTDVVPPNKTVVYNVHLVDVIRTAEEQTQFQKDTTTIHNYIKEKKIANAVMRPNGVWYTIDALGTGEYPELYDVVTFDFKGIVMSNASVFDQGKLTNQSIFGLVDGLKLGMPFINEGGSATFYIPSGFGYGPEGSSPSIPPNANLIFEVKLNTVVK